jgi:hypothetical protein
MNACRTWILIPSAASFENPSPCLKHCCVAFLPYDTIHVCRLPARGGGWRRIGVLIDGGMVTRTPTLGGRTIGGVTGDATYPNCPALKVALPDLLVTMIAPDVTSTCNPLTGMAPPGVGTPPQSLWQNRAPKLVPSVWIVPVRRGVGNGIVVALANDT